VALAAAAAVLVSVGGSAGAAGGRLTDDGTLVVEYSGTDDQGFVDQPSDPALWQATMHFEWDETETVALRATSNRGRR
jgi:hypothetical protein